MNTAINKGKGRAIVFATGNQTEMGKIASTLMHGKKAKTPLQLVIISVLYFDFLQSTHYISAWIN